MDMYATSTYPWDTISSSVPRCTYLDAIMQMHVGSSMSILECITYMYIYAPGIELWSPRLLDYSNHYANEPVKI